MEGIFALFLLLLLAIFLLLVAAIPSMLNLIITFFAYRLFRKIFKSRTIPIVIGIAVSIALTFNLRAKDVLRDIFTDANNSPTMNKTTIKSNESLFIESNIENISYRESKISTLSIDYSSNCGCISQRKPKFTKENIHLSISKLGIATSNLEKSAYQLHIDSVKEIGSEKIHLTLYKEGKILNTKTIFTRQLYPGEGYLLEKEEFSTSAIINYAFGYTFWVPIFESLFEKSTKSELFSSALKSMLTVENAKVPSNDSTAILVTHPTIDKINLLDPARSGKKIGCTSDNISLDPIGSHKHVLSVNGNRIPVEIGNTFESIVCVNSKIYVIETPSNYENFFKVYEFDDDGAPVAHAKYRIDPVEWQGYPRKPLVYFKKNGDFLLLGVLDINEQNTVNTPYFYSLTVPSSIKPL